VGKRNIKRGKRPGVRYRVVRDAFGLAHDIKKLVHMPMDKIMFSAIIGDIGSSLKSLKSRVDLHTKNNANRAYDISNKNGRNISAADQ
jgi:hypothetical protein